MEVQTGTGLFLHFSGKIRKPELEYTKNIDLESSIYMGYLV